MSKTITLVARRTPYGGDKARQTLDIAFAAAVFDHEVRYVFIGDGVWQLKKEQSASEIDRKPHAAALETLELYGIDKIYALQDSLSERQLDINDLIANVQVVDDATVRTLLAGPGHIINL